MLATKSNPLLAVKELHFAKQGSMNFGEFHAHVVKIVRRCKLKAINLMNEEGKELTVDKVF